MFTTGKRKVLSMALALILSLSLGTGFIVNQAQACCGKETVYVLKSVEMKYDKIGSTISTRLSYNKNGSVKKVNSTIVSYEPEVPQGNQSTIPGTGSINPADMKNKFSSTDLKGMIASTNITDILTSTDIKSLFSLIDVKGKINSIKMKKVTSTSKTTFAYNKKGKLKTVTSYNGNTKARVMKYQYKGKKSLMKGIEMKETVTNSPMLGSYVSITKRDKKNRITAFETQTADKTHVLTKVAVKYNKKGYESKRITTTNIPPKTKITMNYVYDKHNNVKEVNGFIKQKNFYKNGLLVKQEKTVTDALGISVKSTITFKYKKMKVSGCKARAVKKQQWALQNMDKYQSSVLDELLF